MNSPDVETCRHCEKEFDASVLCYQWQGIYFCCRECFYLWRSLFE